MEGPLGGLSSAGECCHLCSGSIGSTCRRLPSRLATSYAEKSLSLVSAPPGANVLVSAYRKHEGMDLALRNSTRPRHARPSDGVDAVANAGCSRADPPLNLSGRNIEPSTFRHSRPVLARLSPHLEHAEASGFRAQAPRALEIPNAELRIDRHHLNGPVGGPLSAGQ
jgi:hypothetical protein